jgi:hypothetical protein
MRGDTCFAHHHRPNYIFIERKSERERERVRLWCMRSIDDLCTTDYFFTFKVQKVNLGQNIFHIKI